MKTAISIFLFIILMASCNSDDTEEPGKLEKIGLEKSELNINNEEHETLLSTKNNGWSILEVSVIINGDTIRIENETYLYTDDEVQDVRRYKEIMTGDWFQIIRKESKLLEVQISKNTSGIERELIIELGGGPMMPERLKIKQSKN
ncbi:MAG: hypothetical protein LBV43_12665 [Prevotella sp.]|jgi:hypothetical protein|nr:hypothetical protein [Prevotella sp.]